MLRFFLMTLFVFTSNAIQGNDNIVVLLDTSGSMYDTLKNGNGDKISAAKNALTETLLQVPSSTNLGILTFDAWLTNLEPINDKSKNIIDKINNMTISGRGTPLGEFMKVGADALLQERVKEKGVGTYRFLIITDGEANDSSLVEQYLPDILSRGIIVDVIGVDMSSSHSLANKVHSYKDVNDLNSLKKAINSVLAEVSNNQDSIADFELMEGLSEKESASKIIDVISYLSNDPIGEKKQYNSSQIQSYSQQNESKSGVFCYIITSIVIAFIAFAIFMGCVVSNN